MDITHFIGIGASIGTGLYLLPQLIKISREKKAEDLSLPMLAVLFAGLVLWIIYGIRKSDWIIVASNIVSITLNICIAWLSIRYKKDKAKHKG